MVTNGNRQPSFEDWSTPQDVTRELPNLTQWPSRYFSAPLPPLHMCDFFAKRLGERNEAQEILSFAGFMALGIAGGMYRWLCTGKLWQEQEATSARLRFKEKRMWCNREVILEGAQKNTSSERLALKKCTMLHFRSTFEK